MSYSFAVSAVLYGCEVWTQRCIVPECKQQKLTFYYWVQDLVQLIMN
jgi:hypothetical protein